MQNHLLSNLDLLLTAIPQTALIIIITEIFRLLAKKIINNLIFRLNHRKKTPSKRLNTLGSILKNSLKYFSWSVALMMILSAWKINIAPILAGAGVLGLAIGFGAQTLVRDIITGFFLLLENFINIGDHVKIAGLEGHIVSIKLRTTIIRDQSGTTHIIPNSMISTITKFPDHQSHQS